MTEIPFNMDTYLQRINYEGTTELTLETLFQLHKLHVFNIPFENLDVLQQKSILLDRDSLYRKIVLDNRGGYCFEMNGLFSYILEDLGFEAINLLARVYIDSNNFGSRTHQVLLVVLNNQRWLVDVGFGGGGLIEPILLEEGAVSQQFFETFRLLKDPNIGFVLQRKFGTEFRNVYAFTLDSCIPADYVMSNYFTSTFPGGFFTETRIITKPTTEGRVTLVDKILKISSGNQISEKTLTSDSEYHEVLKEFFGLNMELSL